MDDIIRGLFAIFVVIGLLFFLWGRALPTANMKKRAVGFIVLGMVLFVLFFISFLMDYTKGEPILEYWNYFGLMIITLSFTLSIAIPMIVRANRFYIHLTKRYRDRSYFTKQESAYVVYLYHKEIYLKNTKAGYQGNVISLRKIHFHDEAVRLDIEEKKLMVEKTSHRGTVFLEEKEAKTYYCYLVVLTSPSLIKGFESFSIHELPALPMQEIDKEIVLRMMLNEPFEIRKGNAS